MSQFHNPYHFVPLPDAPPAETAPLAEFDAPKRGQAPKPRRHPHLTHDRFVTGARSGRIECLVTVETPLICANEQEEQEDRPGACKRLLPFSLDGGVTPAIPGAGLRGMLSSLIEAASGSALRVLSDTAIEQVSVSSIWRAGNGSVHEYFADLSPDLLPLAPGRETLALADQLLGAVEVRDAKQQKALKNSPAFALASRVRFHHARLESEPEGGAWQYEEDGLLSDAQLQAKTRHGLERFPLKNLASPKPPSPSLYFKPKTENGGRGGYVPKGKLNPRAQAPQGRKFYLRRDAESYDASAEAFVHPGRLVDERERASIAKQHQSVEKFVRPGATFRFAIDFSNLSDLELQLLVYALEPCPSFRHQIGHGKPLGLGQARLEIAAIRTVDRRRRYAEDPLAGSRWHQEQAETEEGDRSALSSELERLRGGFREWAEANRLGPVLKAIELIGTPLAAEAKVHYPQADEVNRGTSREPRRETIHAGTAAFEREHYHWFVRNDDTADRRNPGQYLAPLVDARGQVAATLPQLDRRQQDDPPPTNYAGPTLPPAPRGGRPPAGGVGGAGGAPNPVRPPAQQGQAPGPTLSSPRDLVGKAVKAKVERYDTKKGKTRIRFRVECEGHVLHGYLAQPDPNRDRATYPEGDGAVHDFILFNPQKGDDGWLCDLRKP